MFIFKRVFSLIKKVELHIHKIERVKNKRKRGDKRKLVANKRLWAFIISHTPDLRSKRFSNSNPYFNLDGHKLNLFRKSTSFTCPRTQNGRGLRREKNKNHLFGVRIALRSLQLGVCVNIGMNLFGFYLM
jgi:hypothetical protein